MGGTKEQKAEYFLKLKSLVEEYKSCFIVTVDNVGSQQMHVIRKSLRGQAVVLLGKNTMIRRALRQFVSDIPELDRLLPLVRGNVGFVFTNGDLKDIREKIVSQVVAAPARTGAIAPVDVYVEPGNTGMDPSKTSFFQALGVPTKIARGTIEISAQVHLVHKDTKVGSSEATLLNMLNISPFTYGMKVLQVYDNGQTFGPEVLDITDDVLLGHFMLAVRNVTAISLAANYPTIVSVFHSVINAYKNLLAVSVATEYTFEGSEKVSCHISGTDGRQSWRRRRHIHHTARSRMNLQFDRKSPSVSREMQWRPHLKQTDRSGWRPVSSDRHDSILSQRASTNCNVSKTLTVQNRSRSTLPTRRRSPPLLRPPLPPTHQLPRLPHRPRRRRRRSLTRTWASVSLTKRWMS